MKQPSTNFMSIGLEHMNKSPEKQGNNKCDVLQINVPFAIIVSESSNSIFHTSHAWLRVELSYISIPMFKVV